jgi:hypothetical protein
MFYYQAYVTEIFQVLVKKIAFEWDMTLCSPVKTNRRLRGIFCLRYKIMWRGTQLLMIQAANSHTKPVHVCQTTIFHIKKNVCL